MIVSPEMAEASWRKARNIKNALAKRAGLKKKASRRKAKAARKARRISRRKRSGK